MRKFEYNDGKSEYPLELLKEQRDFCLHNFGCALDQVFDSLSGTKKRKNGLLWLVRTLENLDEIESLIKECEQAF